MKSIAIIGAFGNNLNLLNGQTIKTKIIANELEKKYGINAVWRIDTYGKLNNLVSVIKCVFAFIWCRNLIILPASNAIKVLAPWLAIWNKLFNRRLHYIVIGGWLDSFLNNNSIVEKSLHSFYGIYVETHTMMKALQKRGYTNIIILPNCKDLRILKNEELKYFYSEPFRLVTFSRVMKEKGIEDAAFIISEINREFGRRVFELDIYGQVDMNELEWFNDFTDKYKIKDNLSDIKYKGCVPFDKSVDILSEYFALLFPTRFYTEGIPGTIIDAYAAGLPVIAAKWESFADVVDDGVTGIGFEFENWFELKNILLNIMEAPDIINKKKSYCINYAKKFLPYNIISKINISEIE